MKFAYLFLIFGMLFSQQVLASEPVVTRNVPVLQNASPAQCPSSWEGEAGPDSMVDVTGAGEMNTLTSPIVMSCTGCAIDPNTRACVCGTCYQHFDN